MFRSRYPWTEDSTNRRNWRTEGFAWNGGYIQYIHASNSAWIFELLVFQTCLLRVHELGWISNLQDFKAWYSMFYFWAYELSKAFSKSYPSARSSSSVHIWLDWLTIVRFCPRGGRSVFITALLSPLLKNKHSPWSFVRIRPWDERSWQEFWSVVHIWTGWPFVRRGQELTRVSKWCILI